MAYFSNGSEGMILEEQCARCPLGEKPCPITLVQLLYNYKQVGIPTLRDAMNHLINEQGQCQMLPLLTESK